MDRISKKIPILLLGVILIVSFGVMFSVSGQESPIMDELAHIPAGYTYLEFQDYRLNPEHPPLVKMLAAVPLLFLKLNFPITDPSWTTAVNGEWALGKEFLFNSGNDPNTIVNLARIAPMLLTLLLIALIYFFSVELLGEWWALLPAFIFGLSPTILSNGHYVTTDVGAALGIFIAIFAFNKYITSPTLRNFILAGLAFGLAQLFKFSAVFLVPFFLVLVTFYVITTVISHWGYTPEGTRWGKLLAPSLNHYLATILIFIIGMVIVVYPVYYFTTENYPIQKQQADTVHILNSYPEPVNPSINGCNNLELCAGELDIALTQYDITRPYAQFLLGVIMDAHRSTTDARAYFMGQVVGDGGWSYFPIVYGLKEPIPILILLILTIGLSLWSIYRTTGRRHPKFPEYLSTNFQEFSMFLFTVMYVGYCIYSPLNIGLRYLIPVLPLMYILMTVGLKKWVNGGHAKLKIGFIALMLVWFSLEVVFAYPYYLSYFNEIVGTQNGYKYVTDSNYDWGQDLKRLATFVKQNNINSIAVDYFGGGDPTSTYYLGNAAVPWQSEDGDPRESGIHWLAVSVNLLQLDTEPLGPGITRDQEGSYAWLTKIRPPAPGMGNVPPPDYIVGTSIFIYKLDGAPGT